MPTKCNRCGVETNTPEIFFKAPDSSESNPRRFCPPCWDILTVSSYKKALLWQSVPGLLGLGLLLFSEDTSAGWTFVNIFLFQVFMLCTILPHELAHLTAARLLGYRVFKMIIGMGKTLFTRNIFGFPTEFKILPAGGLAIAAPTTKKYFRLKQFGFIFAGPFINLLLAALVYPFVSDELWSISALSYQLAPGLAFFYTNLFVLTYNLWPHDVTTSLGKLPSDGKLLLQTFRIKPETIEQSLAARFVYEAAEDFQKKDYQKARHAIEEGLRRYPENFYLLNWLSLLLIRFREFPEARAVSFKILAESEKVPLQHAMILNNIAYVDALMCDHELLPEADDFSQKAMANLAWHPAIKGTRGTVLVELGRIEEGIVLLKQSISGHEDIHGKAENACFLAMAESKLGNFTAGQQYLDEARRYDSTCYMLERAEICLKTLA